MYFKQALVLLMSLLIGKILYLTGKKIRIGSYCQIHRSDAWSTPTGLEWKFYYYYKNLVISRTPSCFQSVSMCVIHCSSIRFTEYLSFCLFSIFCNNELQRSKSSLRFLNFFEFSHVIWGQHEFTISYESETQVIVTETKMFLCFYFFAVLFTSSSSISWARTKTVTWCFCFCDPRSTNYLLDESIIEGCENICRLVNHCYCWKMAWNLGFVLWNTRLFLNIDIVGRTKKSLFPWQLFTNLFICLFVYMQLENHLWIVQTHERHWIVMVEHIGKIIISLPDNDP